MATQRVSLGAYYEFPLTRREDIFGERVAVNACASLSAGFAGRQNPSCGRLSFETGGEPRWVSYCHCASCRAPGARGRLPAREARRQRLRAVRHSMLLGDSAESRSSVGVGSTANFWSM